MKADPQTLSISSLFNIKYCHTREGGYPVTFIKDGFPFSPTVGALSTGMTEKGIKIIF